MPGNHQKIRGSAPKDTGMKLSFRMTVRQLMKMLLQNVVLPWVYGFWHLVYRGKSRS